MFETIVPEKPAEMLLLVCDLSVEVRKKLGRTSERGLLGTEKEKSEKV
jgi:hypothetical protein